MTDLYEYYIDEKLNRQRAVARAKRYSAKCCHKRQSRYYAVAVAVGLLLAFCYLAWQITRPEPELIESAPTSFIDIAPDPVIHEPVVSANLAPIGEFTLTAYCPCETCCGQWALNRPLDANGEPIIYTASGEIAQPNFTVAVDPDVIPLGTEICIEGLGVFKAQDTGAFSGSVIDVYFTSHEAACAFGSENARPGEKFIIRNVWEVYYYDGVST